MIGEVISTLATSVDARWQEKHYDSEALPEIAFEELRRADLASKLSYDDVLRRVMAMEPVQNSYDKFANFGQTIWQGTHFYIEFLLWLDSTTAKHQHGFSGAFQVIHGASCHSTFGFTRSERVNDRMELGDMEWLGTDILRKGDIQRIPGGESYIHSLFHLNEPSMTLVLRTHGLPTYQPQWNYHAPSVRTDPFLATSGMDYTLDKKKKVVAVGWQCSLEFGDDLANRWLENCDVESAFRFLIDAARPGPNEGTEVWRAAIHRRLNQRWPALWPACERAIEEQRRNSDVTIRRKKVSDSEQRFVLAMLMNIPDGQTILDLVKAEFDSEEPQTIIAEQLFAMGVEGCGIRMKETSAEILAHAVSGLNLASIVAALREVYGVDEVVKNYGLIEQNYQTVSEAPLLRAFF